MKIIIFEVESWEREAFKELSAKHDFEFLENSLTEENVSHMLLRTLFPPLYIRR